MSCDGSTECHSQNSESDTGERIIVRIAGEVEVEVVEIGCRSRACEVEVEVDVILRSESHYFKGCLWRKQGGGY